MKQPDIRDVLGPRSILHRAKYSHRPVALQTSFPRRYYRGPGLTVGHNQFDCFVNNTAVRCCGAGGIQNRPSYIHYMPAERPIYILWGTHSAHLRTRLQANAANSLCR